MPTLKRNSPCSILALRGVVWKGTESASSLWLLSVACCSIIKHSHDSNRAISCERGVAIVANCAYPLRYLASRLAFGALQVMSPELALLGSIDTIRGDTNSTPRELQFTDAIILHSVGLFGLVHSTQQSE